MDSLNILRNVIMKDVIRELIEESYDEEDF